MRLPGMHFLTPDEIGRAKRMAIQAVADHGDDAETRLRALVPSCRGRARRIVRQAVDEANWRLSKDWLPDEGEIPDMPSPSDPPRP